MMGVKKESLAALVVICWTTVPIAVRKSMLQ